MMWLLVACYVAVAIAVAVLLAGTQRREVRLQAAAHHNVAGDLYLTAADLLRNGNDEAATAVAVAALRRQAEAEEFDRLHGFDVEVSA